MALTFNPVQFGARARRERRERTAAAVVALLRTAPGYRLRLRTGTVGIAPSMLTACRWFLQAHLPGDPTEWVTYADLETVPARRRY